MSAFENWIEEHGSPIIGEDTSGGTVRLNYISTWANLEIGKPELGSYYPGSLAKYSDYKLADIQLQSKPGGIYVGIELIY